MALLEKQLVVKTSTIPNSGKGLFTKKPIPKGTRIVEYKGRITTWKEMKYAWQNGYIYTVNNNHVIDALPYKKALARYANDAQGLSRVKGITNNCVYINDGVRVYITAVKDIPAGAEILVRYGKDYWDTQRANLRIDRQQEKEKQKEELKKQKRELKHRTIKDRVGEKRKAA
jgi:SET domain-containing protein